MLSIKNIIITLLALVALIGVSSLTTLNQKKPLIAQETFKTSDPIKSIAKPNWWIKPIEPANQSKSAKKSKTVTNQREPVSNFLKIPKNDEWKLTISSGIASAIYDLYFEDKHYELAIIRMNGKVPQEEVLSIWQNKVGLMPKSPYTAINLVTKYNQELKLIAFKGDKKTILLAVHKRHKLTFFRLLSNEGIDEKVTQKFTDFLSEVEIIN